MAAEAPTTAIPTIVIAKIEIVKTETETQMTKTISKILRPEKTDLITAEADLTTVEVIATEACVVDMATVAVCAVALETEEACVGAMEIVEAVEAIATVAALCAAAMVTVEHVVCVAAEAVTSCMEGQAETWGMVKCPLGTEQETTTMMKIRLSTVNVVEVTMRGRADIKNQSYQHSTSSMVVVAREAEDVEICECAEASTKAASRKEPASSRQITVGDMVTVVACADAV